MKKRKYKTKKQKRRIFIIKGSLMSVGLIVVINYSIIGLQKVYDYLFTWDFAIAEVNNIKIEKPELTTIEKIVKYSKQYNVNPDTALRIAYCESRFNINAKNNTSTAKGLYQFLDGTWKHYCSGDRFDEDENIKCFMQLYPKHKNWWACK